jgi:predicted RNase H-like HicB family nuclease
MASSPTSASKKLPSRLGVLDWPMKRQLQLTAIIEREGEGYVALCPELDVASQGESVEEARHNLVEALELFFEVADPTEIEERLHSEVYISRVDIAVG